MFHTYKKNYTQKYNFSAVLFQNVNMASKMAVYAVLYRADMIYILFLKLIVFELIMSLTAWGMLFVSKIKYCGNIIRLNNI
jgi:hypothetical protein